MDFGENYVVYELDEGRHDFHQKSALMRLFKDIFVKILKVNNEDPMDKAVMKWLNNRIEESSGFMTGGIFWRMIATLGSGDNHTTVYNTNIIALKMIYAAHKTKIKNKLTKNFVLFHAFSLGDDNYSVVHGDYSEDFIFYVKEVSHMLRFDTDVIKTNIMYGAFCSSTFVPCSRDGEDNWFLTPRFGKIMSRTFYSYKAWSDINSYHYCKEIAQCMYLEFQHIDFIKNFFKKIMDLCGVSTRTSEKVKRFVEKRYSHQRAVFGKVIHKIEESPNTMTFIKRKYFLTDEMIEEFVQIYETLESPFCVLDCPLLQHFHAVDNLGVTKLEDLNAALHNFEVNADNNIHERFMNQTSEMFKDKVYFDSEELGQIINYQQFDVDTKKAVRTALKHKISSR
jgi:hypothetical protein